MNILSPTPELLIEYLNKWNNLENYVYQENSLRKLFQDTYPANNDINDVLVKVCVLNDFYSTNIFSPFSVAKHIISLKADSRLEENNLQLVNDLAQVKMKNGKIYNFYSFATKYCSHHKPTIYPIYDSYVEKLLKAFRKQDEFASFKNQDLKDYPKYKSILIQLQDFYGLNSFNLKEIDKYLWQVGKEYFKKYGSF